MGLAREQVAMSFLKNYSIQTIFFDNCENENQKQNGN